VLRFRLASPPIAWSRPYTACRNVLTHP
jgi:hypothetical protein